MSTLDVVAEILREVAPRALNARQIVDLAAGRLPTASKTPETVVSRDLAIDVKDRGAASRFLRVGRGAFILKEALPSAFYSDNDAYVAQWTRNLVDAGEIATGVVDERSIRDLQPADVACYRQCHFFSGIAVWSRALRDAGWPDDLNVWTGSAPCQPWSSAGRRKGHDDERDLWPEWFRLIKACRPAIIFGEQVASKDGLKWLDDGPDLQRMQDREAIIGVLQTLGVQGGTSLAVQGLLQAFGEGVEGSAVEGGSFEGLQEMAIEQSRVCAAVDGQISGEAEGTGIFDHKGRYRSDNQARLLRADRNPVQPQERKNLGQPVDRQDRLVERVCEGQCPCRSVLREYDGECLGLGKDRGNCCGNCGASETAGGAGETRKFLSRAPASELEEDCLEESLHSVRSDLEGIGYSVWALNTPACSVGAPHRRQRIYFVAYARERGCEILGASWLHDRRQSRNNLARCGKVDDGFSTGDGSEDDGSCRVEGRSSELGYTCSDRTRKHCRELPGDEAQHEEWPASGHHPSVVAGQADGPSADRSVVTGSTESASRPLVRGTDDLSSGHCRPGDRIRIAKDPAWGGSVGGFWANAVEWIYCRPTPGHEDGCFRPVEPGTQPLVDGSTAELGRTRTARLRGYGNAIVLPAAAAFISSVIETFVDIADANPTDPGKASG